MAVRTENGVTTITPTAWKWALGGVLILPFMPFSLLISPIFLLTATGKLQNLTLSPEGLRMNNMWKRKTYRWDEIGDFRIVKLKSSFVTAASMVSFTHRNREGTLLGKAAKMLAGGTHSVPSFGMKASQLAQLMAAYQMGHVPGETHPQLNTQAPVSQPQFKAPKSSPSPAPVFGAAKAQPAFGRKSNGMVGKVPAQQNPLVQDGRRRQRQLNSSAFE